MNRLLDRWIRWTTTGCVALLALVAGTASYLHMHLLVELHGQPGWVAPLTVDGMIVAASTTLLADSRGGEHGGKLPWALLVAGSAASLAANVVVAQPTAAGRMIAAWPSFALIGAYELLMRQVRRNAAGRGKPQPQKPGPQVSQRGRWRYGPTALADPPQRAGRKREGLAGRGGAGKEIQRQAWHWALAHRGGDGSLPSGREIARHYGRQERWGRLVKRAGAAGEFSSEPTETAPGRAAALISRRRMTASLQSVSTRRSRICRERNRAPNRSEWSAGLLAVAGAARSSSSGRLVRREARTVAAGPNRSRQLAPPIPPEPID